MTSIWKKTAALPAFPMLREDLQTDVLIVGGGIAGILTAYYLEQAGVKYALLEAETICSGITKDTTAKITSQHGLIYDTLIQRFGPEKARMYLFANQAALKEYRKLALEIDCDFEEKSAYVYALHSRDSIEREIRALDSLGIPAGFEEGLPLPFPVAGAVRFPRQAQFHPLKFLAAIVPGLRIFEHTKVLDFVPGGVTTNGGRIRADRIIVATHYPILNKHGWYFLKLYQDRSYVLALNNAPDVKGMYVDADPKGLSFRNHGDLLLLGGGSHRTGKQGGNWKALWDFAARHYPEAQETARWATQDCVTLDGVPYIGQYSKRTPNLYVATGFNKWGMTSSMVCAMLLTDMMLGKKNPYAPMFSPSRRILRPQLAVNLGESALGLVTPTRPRCPHMGCALTYNRAEHSWDCPCHGSRFTEEGRLIDNPATGDKKMR